MRATPFTLVLLLILAALRPAVAGDSPSARRGASDAAERVQEGNVQQWIEYYERERASAAQSRRPATPSPTPSGDKPPAKP